MLVGSCYICSAPAMFTCSVCGRSVCIQCYDKESRLCSKCSQKYGRKTPGRDYPYPPAMGDNGGENEEEHEEYVDDIEEY